MRDRARRVLNRSLKVAYHSAKALSASIGDGGIMSSAEYLMPVNAAGYRASAKEPGSLSAREPLGRLKPNGHAASMPVAQPE